MGVMKVSMRSEKVKLGSSPSRLTLKMPKGKIKKILTQSSEENRWVQAVHGAKAVGGPSHPVNVQLCNTKLTAGAADRGQCRSQLIFPIPDYNGSYYRRP